MPATDISMSRSNKPPFLEFGKDSAVCVAMRNRDDQPKRPSLGFPTLKYVFALALLGAAMGILFGFIVSG